MRTTTILSLEGSVAGGRNLGHPDIEHYRQWMAQLDRGVEVS
jgi:hypothetical protein